jgi:hypothetical protein
MSQFVHTHDSIVIDIILIILVQSGHQLDSHLLTWIINRNNLTQVQLISPSLNPHPLILFHIILFTHIRFEYPHHLLYRHNLNMVPISIPKRHTLQISTSLPHTCLIISLHINISWELLNMTSWRYQQLLTCLLSIKHILVHQRQYRFLLFPQLTTQTEHLRVFMRRLHSEHCLFFFLFPLLILMFFEVVVQFFFVL